MDGDEVVGAAALDTNADDHENTDSNALLSAQSQGRRPAEDAAC